MGINFSSLVGTASQALEKKRQRKIEDEERAQAREMETLRRALMRAQIGKLSREGHGLASTAQAYIQQYPELEAFAADPQEVIARGRARDTEGLMRERPVVDYPAVNERGEIVLVPRPRQPTSLRPIQEPSRVPQSPPAVGPKPTLKSAFTPSLDQPVQRQPPVSQDTGTRPQASQSPSQRTPGPQPAQGARGTGVRKFSPGLITPSASETDAANWAPGVIQGFTVVRDLVQSNPRAVREAVPFLQALTISADAPAIGDVIADATAAAGQQGLSPEAQRFVQGFLRWRASRVFSTGGKQLTQNEIRAAISQYLPAINEDPGTTQQRLTSMAQDATQVLFATGRAYGRIKQNLTTAGAPDLGDFDPYTQKFTGNITFLDLLGNQAHAPSRSKYGYTRPR